MNRILASSSAALALAACSGAPGAAAEDTSPRTLVVTGTGEASGAPDMATLSIGVETEAPSAAAALQQNGAQMNATIDRLKKDGVAEKDLQTSNLSVRPQYKYDQNGSSPRIVGYTATNSLTVKLRDLSKAGAIIDDAVKDGANTLGGLNFGFADPSGLESTARKNAVADARAKASTLASAAGVTLGPILQINEGSISSPPQPYLAARAMSAEKSTPIAAGEQAISVTVTLVYQIR